MKKNIFIFVIFMLLGGQVLAKTSISLQKNLIDSKVIQKNITKPINIGSGKGTSIKNLIKLIVSSKNIKNKPKIIFDKTKKSGDKKRVLDTSFAESKNIKNKTKLKDGINKTIKWYLANKDNLNKKFNYFSK